MSKAWERAMGVLDEPDPSDQGKTVVIPKPVPLVSRCWRCMTNPSRVSGEDFTCEPCLAWITGASDKDPRQGFTINMGRIFSP